MDKVKEMVEFAKTSEVETIEKGNDVMMKIIAFDEKEQAYIFVLADWSPKDFNERDKLLQGIGLKMHEMMKELKSLILISDTYYAKFPTDKELSPIEQIIMSDINSGKRRLENLPPELHRYRGDALMVLVSSEGGKDLSLNTLPYKTVNGRIEWDEPLTQFSKYEDNMLSNIWKGWNLK